MKRLVLGILIAFFVIVLSGATIALAMPEQAANGGKAKAPDLEKIEFIHWKKDFAKPDTAKGPKAPSCYKLMRVKLPSTASYVINPGNLQGLTENHIKRIDERHLYD
jgi:hypothetical protein